MREDPRFYDRLRDFDLRNAASKRDYNLRVFSKVALRYNAVTRILSFGRDAAWKRTLVESLPEGKNLRILDLATGTGDIAFLLGRRYPDAGITAVDLNPEMIRRSSLALERSPVPAAVTFSLGDMNALDFPDGSFDIVTGGYALRNAPDLKRAIAEIFRVLVPGGTAAFLDFSLPQDDRGRQVRLKTLRLWGGLWGWVFHRNPEVYSYIAESLATFSDRSSLTAQARAAGFVTREPEALFLGFMDLNFWEKPRAN